MERRDFVKACAAAASAASLPNAAQAADAKPRTYRRAKLVDDKGVPIRLAELKPGQNYVFDYPFESTPCFLLNLGRSVNGGTELKTVAGEAYRWNGGVGPQKSVVAYSAICAHKLTYPTRQVSFIGYREAPSAVAPQGRVITCCSDRSVYDPAAGAKVVTGPAPQPLAAILLEHDAKTDELFAVGTYGGEMFNEFFKRFEFRLQLEAGPRAKSEVEGTTVVKPMERYSSQWAQC
jgi:arsenite oxidase small subunit